MTIRVVRSSTCVLSSLALALTSACAGLVPPVQSSGPSVSQEGIQFAVIDQRCTQSEEPVRANSDSSEELVAVQVRNLTRDPVTISRDEFRLMTLEGHALKPSSLGMVSPLILDAGQTSVFQLRFTDQGELRCASELVLDPGSGFRVGNRSLKLGVVRFVPDFPTSAPSPVRSVTPRRSCPSCD